MISRVGMVPRLAHLTIRSLAADIKLKAINNLRLVSNLSPVNSLPPAQITLTPAAPSMGGQNYLVVHGGYGTQPGSAAMSLLWAEDFLTLMFAAVAGKTYLLDVAVSGSCQNWSFTNWTSGHPTPDNTDVTPQQGHLLIPFIASCSFFNATLTRYGSVGQVSQFLSAELTRVD
jgi:hypothetical protein